MPVTLSQYQKLSVLAHTIKSLLHRLSACPQQPSVGSHYIGKSVSCVRARSVPRFDETSKDDNYQPGFHTQSYLGTHEPGLAHPNVTRGYQKWSSHRGCHEASNRHAPALLPKHRELGISQQPIVDRGPVRPYPQVCLPKCRTSQLMQV